MISRARRRANLGLRRPSMLVLALIMFTGCNDAGNDFVSVSGKVTLDGQPLSDAVVQFYLTSAPPTAEGRTRPLVASGRSDSNGHFSLRSLTPDNRTVDGAAVGNHRVTIQTQIIEYDNLNGDRVIREELLPAKYHEDTQLTYEVDNKGTDECLFELRTR